MRGAWRTEVLRRRIRRNADSRLTTFHMLQAIDASASLYLPDVGGALRLADSLPAYGSGDGLARVR